LRPLYLDHDVDCASFREWLYHLQADELADGDREKLLGHAAACGRCARYLEAEDSFLMALKGRLAASEAPAGLEARVRDALGREAPPTSERSWVRTPAASVLAAGLLLAVLLVPALVGRAPGAERAGAAAGKVLHVVRTVTVVDFECDTAGASFARQLECRNARHLNVLKLADGSYWNVNLDHPSARAIVMDRRLRGRRITVEADFYPELQAVRLIRVHDAGSPL
jgi:hypothetical protein